MPRFLVSRLSALGDVVCTLPVASALKQIPHAHLVWIVDPRFAGIVECCPDVDEVIRWKPSLDPRKAPDLGEPFEAAFDMQGLLKSALPVGYAKAKQKLGYHWQREGSALFSSRVLPDPTSFHVVDQYLDVVRAFGVECDAAKFALEPRPEDLAKVQQLLAESGITGPFVAANAGAGWASKRWPPASFAAVLDAAAEAGFQAVLLGGKAEGDRAAASEVLSLCKSRPADLLGETSVRELVALIHYCRAHIGGDTGSTHLAAALGRPAVGLYSVTRPKRTCPYGQFDRCHYDPERLGNISPDAVLRTLMEALQ